MFHKRKAFSLTVKNMRIFSANKKRYNLKKTEPSIYATRTTVLRGNASVSTPVSSFIGLCNLFPKVLERERPFLLSGKQEMWEEGKPHLSHFHVAQNTSMSTSNTSY
jgi:hypothetical protein